MADPDLAGYLEMAQESYAVAYVTIACASLLIFDWFLTITDEISNIWNSRWAIPKFLFFVNRYVVVAMLCFNGIASSQTHLPAGFCVFYLRWLVTITVSQSTIEAILLTRVWALYRGNTPVLCLASFFYAGGVITLVSLTVQDYVGEAVEIVQDFSSLPGCYAASVPGIIAGYWIAPVIIESVFFGLVIWRALSWWRDRSSAPPTLVLMARDSAVYFAVVFVLLIVNLFVFEYAPPFLSSLFVTPGNTAGCIAGSRMLLNLRTFRPVTTTQMEMSTHIDFKGKRRQEAYTSPSTGMTGTTYSSTEIEQHMEENENDEEVGRADQVPLGGSGTVTV